MLLRLLLGRTCASTPSTPAAKTDAVKKTARNLNAWGTPAAAKADISKAAQDGPTTTAICDDAATRARAAGACAGATSSVAAAWATGTLAAKAPHRKRHTTIAATDGDMAMPTLPKVAPAKHKQSVWPRPPAPPDRRTNNGQQTIWATLKNDVARATSTGFAPRRVRCSGSVAIAIPSPIICANTLSVTGSSARGSGASASASIATAAARGGASNVGGFASGARAGPLKAYVHFNAVARSNFSRIVGAWLRLAVCSLCVCSLCCVASNCLAFRVDSVHRCYYREMLMRFEAMRLAVCTLHCHAKRMWLKSRLEMRRQSSLQSRRVLWASLTAIKPAEYRCAPGSPGVLWPPTIGRCR